MLCWIHTTVLAADVSKTLGPGGPPIFDFADLDAASNWIDSQSSDCELLVFPGKYQPRGPVFLVSNRAKVRIRAVAGTPQSHQECYDGSVVMDGSAGGVFLVDCWDNGSLTLQGITFSGWSRGAVLRLSGADCVVRDCRFYGNSCEAARSMLRAVHRPAHGTPPRFENCLFYENEADECILEANYGAIVAGCTFDNNSVGDHADVSFRGGHAHVRNCVFSRYKGTGQTPCLQFTGTLDAAFLASDRSYSPVPGVRGWLQVADLGFTNLANHDYRPRFKSVLEDAGDPSFPRDFDLSYADIGWKQKYPVRPISESFQGEQVKPGWYTVDTQTTHDFPTGMQIKSDVVLRVTSAGANTYLNTSGDIVIGESGKPRVAFVGGDFDPVNYNLIAGSYFSLRGNTSTRSNATIHGLLLNVAPSTAFSFGYMKNLSLVGSKDAEDENLQLANLGHANLHFVDVTGTLRDFYFDDNGHNQFLDTPYMYDKIGVRSVALVLGGKLRVKNCSFVENQTPAGNYYPLYALCGTNTSLIDCDFNCSESYADRPIAQLSNGATRMLRNTFTGGEELQLGLLCNATDMSDEGCNGFSVEVHDVDCLVHEIHGHTLMDCGYNGFANRDWLDSDSRFFYSESPDPVSLYWRNNFWGEDQNTSIPDCSILDHNPNGEIPAYADGSLCIGFWGPTLNYTPFCPDPNGNIDDVKLWDDGNGAEELGLSSDAVWYYSELVLLYPQSKYAAEAASRLKELGKYQSDEKLAIASTLEAAAVGSAEADLSWQAAMQYSAAQCVLARAGDVEGARANLQAVLLEGANEAAVETATLALLEIATYPSVGATSSLGGHEAQRQQEAVQNMLDYRPLSSAGAEPGSRTAQPAAFQLGEVYPNPFNPTTSITLQVNTAQTLTVEVYNLQGQLVSTLHQGHLDAGSHQFQFDGSALASGCYLVRAAGGGQLAMQKMLMVK